MTAQHTAAIVAVGTELLADTRLDTNSLSIARLLARYGVQLVEKRVVGDVVEHIADAVGGLIETVEVVIITGGLGPTADDLTRTALAEALGRSLRHDDEIEAWLRERYRTLGREMPSVCRSMAQVVEGSRPLLNSRGAAPGILTEAGDCLVVALPGVPLEMEGLLSSELAPELARRFPTERRVSRTLLLGGVLESEVEGRIRPLYEHCGQGNVTILGSPGAVRLVLSARGAPERASSRLDEMTARFAAALGDDVAGEDVSGLAEVVLHTLADRKQTLATAESCTGGLVSTWLTDVPGSSSVFLGGVVSYSNEAKEHLVGVPGQLLIEHGAVSEPVARSMAEQVRERFTADWGIGITGIAGPGGGSAQKPVGLVHWAVAGPEGTEYRQEVFQGQRSIVREWSAASTLDLLRRCLLGAAPRRA